jgi:2-methylcitrate dehydratase PrpD
LVEELAEWGAAVTADKLPRDVRASTQRLVFDALSNATAGQLAPGMRLLVAEMASWATGGRASVAGLRDPLPAPLAAAANGAMIHAWEFDDVHDRGVVHCTAAVVPAVLAVADQAGGVLGREALAAIAVGVEVTARMGLALGPLVGFERSAVCGAFGAAAAASRLLGLTPAGIASALGLVYSRCAGHRLGIAEAVWTKRWQMGLAAEAGVTAALLAARGAAAPRRVLDGPFGLFEAYARGQAQPEHLLGQLGERWQVPQVSLKPYPCCRFVHPAVDAAIAVAPQLGGRRIRRITVEIPRAEMLTLIVQRSPVTGEPVVYRQFSLAWCVAAALQAGEFTLDLLAAPESEVDAEVLAERVEVVYGPPPTSPLGFSPMRVTVTLDDGDVLSAACEVPPGSSARSVSEQTLRQKARQCVEFAGRSAADAEVLADLTGRLEALPDVRTLSAWLAEPAGEPRHGIS